MEPPFIYNLSINSVDGSTIYGMISSDRAALLRFLRTYDHEGSGVSLIRRNYVTNDYVDLDYEEVYEELLRRF